MKKTNNDELLEMNDTDFLTVITRHALESKCSCKICYLLRKRHIKHLRNQILEMK